MKINISRIVAAQVRTLRNNATQTYSVFDLVLFFVFPILLGVAGAYYGWKFNGEALNALLAAFSIFAGLLLNLLILVYTLSSQTEHPPVLAKARLGLVKELHDNIAYSILVSIVIVVVSMVAVAHLNMHEKQGEPAFTARWVAGLIIFLTTNFVLTLLMILKRIYIMLNQAIDKPFISGKKIA
ncbi:MAG TPA: hypothetical protein VF860_01520 [Candidatus Acidoferrales bacterium]